MVPTGKTLAGYLPLAIFAGVMLWRLRTMDKARALRPRTFWIPPALVIAAVVWLLAKMPPGPWGMAAFACGLVIGAGVGWQRARWMRLHIEGEGPSARVMVRQSPAAVLLVMAIAGARTVFRAASGSGRSADLMASAHPSSTALVVTDVLLGFALGMIVTHRMALWLRARDLKIPS